MKRLFASYTNAFAPPTQIKLGLELIARLDRELGSPSQKFRSIHIAGTNGKGSVTTKMAYALAYAGYKVGRYTSPHLRSFCERIWVGGSLITEKQMQDDVAQVEKVARICAVQPTFFELLTLVAFLHFAREKVDFAVIEVGMGGRLDATNILQPCLSVITSIDFDHKEHLGDTLEKIAFEKGGIIKSGVPLVVGAGIKPFSMLEKLAQERMSPCYIAERGVDFEEQNQKTAALALSQLSLSLPEDTIRRGLLMKPPCRFQMIREDLPIVLDVAHNLAGLAALFEKLARHFPSYQVVVVAAFSSADKALSMARYLKERALRLWLTQADHERGVETPLLEGVDYAESIAKALQLALEEAEKRGALLLVTGTFFMMEEVFSFFEGKELKGLVPGWANLST